MPYKILAEAILTISNEKIMYILEIIGDNAWMHDFTTGETWFSDGFEDLLGFKLKEIENTESFWYSRVVHEEDCNILRNLVEDYKQRKIDSHSLVCEMKHKDGSSKLIMNRGLVLERTKEGYPIKVIGVHIDLNKPISQI